MTMDMHGWRTASVSRLANDLRSNVRSMGKVKPLQFRLVLQRKHPKWRLRNTALLRHPVCPTQS